MIDFKKLDNLTRDQLSRMLVPTSTKSRIVSVTEEKPKLNSIPRIGDLVLILQWHLILKSKIYVSGSCLWPWFLEILIYAGWEVGENVYVIRLKLFIEMTPRFLIPLYIYAKFKFLFSLLCSHSSQYP